MARISSLKRPRAPVSEMTAAVMVGEKLSMMTTNCATIASFPRPAASGSTGSHGHASHSKASSPRAATPRMDASIRPTPLTDRPSRSKLMVRPAMKAMSAVASVLIVWSCRAIGSVMRFVRYGPITRPNSR